MLSLHARGIRAATNAVGHNPTVQPSNDDSELGTLAASWLCILQAKSSAVVPFVKWSRRFQQCVLRVLKLGVDGCTSEIRKGRVLISQ